MYILTITNRNKIVPSIDILEEEKEIQRTLRKYAINYNHFTTKYNNTAQRLRPNYVHNLQHRPKFKQISMQLQGSEKGYNVI